MSEKAQNPRGGWITSIFHQKMAYRVAQLIGSETKEHQIKCFKQALGSETCIVIPGWSLETVVNLTEEHLTI